MASITIRNLDEQLKSQLRIEAAMNGHSMEGGSHYFAQSAEPPSEGGAGKSYTGSIRRCGRHRTRSAS